MNKIAQWILHSIALYVVSLILPGIEVKNFVTAMIAVVIITLINILIRPVLLLLTLPINILTLGLFTFILNALLFMLAGSVTPGLTIHGFGNALLGSLLFTGIKMILDSLIKK